MSVFNYTAKRRIISGHTLDSVYDLELGIGSYDQEDVFEGDQDFSANQAATTINKDMVYHRFETVPISESKYFEVREFIASCNASEALTFDTYGTVAAPVEVKNGILLFQKNIKPVKVDAKLRKISFTIIEFL